MRKNGSGYPYRSGPAASAAIAAPPGRKRTLAGAEHEWCRRPAVRDADALPATPQGQGTVGGAGARVLYTYRQGPGRRPRARFWLGASKKQRWRRIRWRFAFM